MVISRKYMSKTYTTLETEQITPEETIAEYVYLPKVIHMEDPAIDALLDFRKLRPHTFNIHDSMPDAREELAHSDLHAGLVFDDQHDLVGVISLEQILSRHTVSMIEKTRIERKDVQVNHIMTPLAAVPAINLAQLKHAKVGHVVATLQSLQCFLMIAIEEEERFDKNVVRGVFLASHISKLLGKHIKIDPAQAKSVAELQQKLHK